jgi:hypothetical protein
MFPFIYQYAVDTPQTKATALNLVPANTQNLTAVADNTKNAVLALLVSNDTLSFASAAWYLTQSERTGHTGCTQEIINGLKAGTQAGWEAYITQCVDTSVTDDRRAAYNRALEALPPDPTTPSNE